MADTVDINLSKDSMWSQQRLIGTSFVIGLAILVFIGVTAYQSTAHLMKSADWRAHTYQVIVTEHDLLIDLINAETGQRGYIIRGNERYLEVYQSGVNQVGQDAKKMRELTQDNPRQQKRIERLDPLVAAKLDDMSATIELRKKQGFEVAAQHVATMGGKKLMDAIRKVLNEIESEESALLKDRDTQTKATAKRATLVIISGSLLAFVLVALASFLINRDILKRREAEAERELFFTLSLDMLCIASADGYFKRLNPAFPQTLGWSAAELLARPFLDFVHPDDHAPTIREVEKQTVRGESVLQFENRYQRKDGSYRVLSWKSVPQPGGMMYATARDVTDLRRSEEELKNRAALIEAANKELEAFSYSVSHDLRAPLRHIDGFVDLLQKNGASNLDEKSRRYLNTISDSARQMGSLIDDLLVFSRMGRMEMQKTALDMGLIVKATIENLTQDMKGRKVSWKIALFPQVHGDPAMLKQVFSNLLGNALKYSQTRPSTQIEIGCTEKKEETVFFVKDNGVGFDMQYADKLFGVFQRLHSSDEFEGTGIGLANVRRIVQRHGGKTWAEGAVDNGATFYFSLPK